MIRRIKKSFFRWLYSRRARRRYAKLVRHPYLYELKQFAKSFDEIREFIDGDDVFSDVALKMLKDERARRAKLTPEQIKAEETKEAHLQLMYVLKLGPDFGTRKKPAMRDDAK